MAVYEASTIPSLSGSRRISPTFAQADDADAALVALLDRWSEARARQEAVNEQIWDNEAAIRIPLPDALIKTADDARWFITKEKVGEHYFLPASFAHLFRVIPILISFHFETAPIAALVKRLDDIMSNHTKHERDVLAAREAAGLPALEAEKEAADAIERQLRHDVAATPALTFAGLMAKMRAIAEAIGYEALVDETQFEDDENVSLDAATLTVLRDFVRLAPSVPSSGAFAV